MQKQPEPIPQVNQNQQIAIQTQKAPQLPSRQSNKTFKSKVGIFFGYNGEKYLGMQYQRETQNTIENIIHKMLCDEGFILKSNQDKLIRISWSRAARTDKRVHALCNGISVKLQISEKFQKKQQGDREIDFDKLRDHLNVQLPMDIRMFEIMRVVKGFDMRHDAYSRVYNYIIPVCIFQKYDDYKIGKIPSAQEEIQILQKINSLCKLYLGTHNFNNFTKGYKQNDPRCERYMISMKAEAVEKQVFERYWGLHKDEIAKRDESKERYIRFTLVGQSFIYHQIRKMIGLLVKIFAQDMQGASTIKLAFQPEKFDLYLAPGEGLYLNRMTFETYNNRRQKNNERTVEIDQAAEQRILKFREYLESQILHHQVEQKVFSQWLTNRFEYKVVENEEESAEIEEQEQENNEREGNNNEQEGENRGESKNNDNKNKKNFKKPFYKKR